MSDPVSLARAARENLARGLAALQSPAVPPQVMVVAEPIAHAMSALHRIEASQGAARGEAGPTALNAARQALGMLQQQPPGYAAVDVYEEEPIVDGNHPLLKMPNVLCTPHLGWAEWDNFELYFRECFEQIVRFEKGEPLRLGNPTVKPRAKA